MWHTPKHLNPEGLSHPEQSTISSQETEDKEVVMSSELRILAALAKDQVWFPAHMSGGS